MSSRGVSAGSVLDAVAPGALHPDELDGWDAAIEAEFAPEPGPNIWDVLDGTVPPGPEAVRILAACDPSQLDADDRARYATAWERQGSWVESCRLRAVVELAGPEPSEAGGLWARLQRPEAETDEETLAELVAEPRGSEDELIEETRQALQTSENYAQRRVWLARTLTTRLPVTMRSLTRGRISPYHVQIINDLSAELTAEQCAELERRVYPRGEKQSGTQFRRAVRKVIAVLRPQELEERHAEAVARDTGVTVRHLDNGMSAMTTTATTVAIMEILGINKLEATTQAKAAKASGGPHIPIGQRRVDVFRRWARGALEELNDRGLVAEGPDDPIDEDEAADALAEAATEAATGKVAGSPPGTGWMYRDRTQATARDLARASELGSPGDVPLASDPGDSPPSGGELTAPPPLDIGDPQVASDVGRASEPAGLSLLDLPAREPDPDEPPPRPRLGAPPGPITDPANPLKLRPGIAAPITISLICDPPMLFGLASGIAMVEGCGPIPASLARLLAADAKWQRMVLEPINGHLLDYGRTTYSPPAKLRDYLLRGEQTCRGAFCNCKPVETDHGLDWAKGGATSALNMNGLCKHCHRLKTMYNVTVENHEDGSVTWISPAGTRYTEPPEDLRITNYGLDAPAMP